MKDNAITYEVRNGALVRPLYEGRYKIAMGKNVSYIQITSVGIALPHDFVPRRIRPLRLGRQVNHNYFHIY